MVDSGINFSACFSTGTILALSAIEDHISETIEKDKDRRAQAEILLKLLTAALREMGTTWGTAFTSAAVIDGTPSHGFLD